MQKDGTRHSSTEVCCEWPDLLPAAMVRFQPELPLRAISVSMAMQCQGLLSMFIVYITIRELIWAATRDYLDVQGLCRTALAPHSMRCSGDLAPTLTQKAQWIRP